MEEETLEEAASRLYPEEWNWREKNSFFEGAQWQADRMYNKQDMIEYSNYCLDYILNKKK